jgi:hypothetical protein
MNIWRQAVRPKKFKGRLTVQTGGERPEVAEELRWSPVTHLFVHQDLADTLLFGE